MRKIYFLILIFAILTSCNLKEKMQKMERINTELEKEFKHPEINSNYHFGTEEDDNYIQINFYSFDLSEKTHSELEKMANMVNQFFLERNPEFDDLDFIEVRFTKSDKKTANSFVNFFFE
ncbi:MAG: hypothetical protein V2I62_07550 [Bacteroidales bacterium]|jgi:hypothetical protein|nr:hypothetical protein [Bacteroidales bacterium]